MYVDSEEVHEQLYNSLEISNLYNYFPDFPFPALPYCSTVELQNFHKRFRINLKRYCVSHNIDGHEVFTYSHYSVSEYGSPIYHLRPHYHCLFFSNSQQFCEILREVLSKSWKFGFVRVRTATAAAGYYVSSYLNSAMLLPEPFKIDGFKVGQVHSVGLLQKLFKERIEEVYQFEPGQVIEYGLSNFLPTDTESLPGNVSSFLFPKCFNFSRSTPCELYKVFTFYSTVKEYLDSYNCDYVSVIQMAHFIAIDFLNSDTLPFDIRDLVSRCNKLNEGYKPLLDFIYRLLLFSRHFLNDICSGSSNPLFILNRIDYICRFYYKKDMKLLSDFYSEQEEILNDPALWFTVLYLYNNFLHFVPFEFRDRVRQLDNRKSVNFHFDGRLELNQPLFSNSHFIRFFESFDVSPPFPGYKVIDSTFYKFLDDSSYLQALNRVKHKELYDLQYVQQFI